MDIDKIAAQFDNSYKEYRNLLLKKNRGEEVSEKKIKEIKKEVEELQGKLNAYWKNKKTGA